MLLKMYCKNMNGKQMVNVGQMTMFLGLGCTSGSILLDRFTQGNDFLLGFLIGFGTVLLGISIVFNVRGLKLQKKRKTKYLI